MKYDLVIDSRPSEVVIALLRDGLLIELHKEKHDNNYSAGDIYLGKVRKTNPGLNASFVSVGYEKDGFLHYLDFLAMWKIAYADGNIDKYEEHIIRKVSNLIYVAHSDFIKAKLSAKEQI